MICSIVVLYEPKLEELNNILNYYNLVDYSLILDNSKQNHQRKIEDLLKDKEQHYIYKHFPENIGLCKALNYGMKNTQQFKCEWVLLMDADSSFITNIVEIYKKKIIDIDDKIAILAPVHIHDRSFATKYNGEKSVKWAMTSGCLYNVEIFMEIGGFMEELFIDGLDIDFCYKVREAGYKVIECGEALLQHYPAETKEFKILGKIIFKYGVSSTWRYRTQARSLVWLTLKYHQFPDVIRYLWRWFKVIFLFDKKRQYFKEMLIGSKEGFELWRKQRLD